MCRIFVECVSVTLKIISKFKELISTVVFSSEEGLEEGIPLRQIAGSLSGVAGCCGCLDAVCLDAVFRVDERADTLVYGLIFIGKIIIVLRVREVLADIVSGILCWRITRINVSHFRKYCRARTGLYGRQVFEIIGDSKPDR